MGERIEQRECSTHGRVSAIVTYEDGIAFAGMTAQSPISIECPLCTQERVSRQEDMSVQLVNRERD